ncbi:Dabb family protein [Mesorhizobium sp. SB112]|uniref:Dabb family protein n=1 Tax=Mesorhizobium sp. SB112 TaxID=3151853 RepID=UPI003266D336
MIYHCIRMSIKPEVSKEQANAILERMRRESVSNPLVRSLVIGPDYGGEFDYGAITAVENLADYEAMMNDPTHREIDRIGLPLVEKFMSFDITDDADPDMNAKIANIHRRRYQAMPDVAGLVSGLAGYSGSSAPASTGISSKSR